MLATASLFVGSLLLVPLLPTGFIPPDDLSQTRSPVTLPPAQHAGRDHLCAAEQARALVRRQPACEAGLHRHRRRQAAGADPFAPRAQAEVRKAVLTDQPDAPRRAPRHQQTGHRGRLRRRSRRCRGAHQGRLGRPAKSTSWCWPARTGRAGRARAQVERELRGIPASARGDLDAPAWSGRS